MFSPFFFRLITRDSFVRIAKHEKFPQMNVRPLIEKQKCYQHLLTADDELISLFCVSVCSAGWANLELGSTRNRRPILATWFIKSQVSVRGRGARVYQRSWRGRWLLVKWKETLSHERAHSIASHRRYGNLRWSDSHYRSVALAHDWVECCDRMIKDMKCEFNQLLWYF